MAADHRGFMPARRSGTIASAPERPCDMLLAIATDSPQGPVLTHGQAAYVLGISKGVLGRGVRQGRLTPVDVTPGGHRRYLPADVHGLLPPQKLRLLRTRAVANADSRPIESG